MPEAPGAMSSEGIITKTTTATVSDTVARLSELLAAQNITLFAVVDHSGEAQRHGLELRDTKVVIFGSPLAGTPVMQAVPLAALDLPLKLLIWDDLGQTRISYLDPRALGERYHLEPQLASRLAGIDALTDRLSAG